MASFLVLLALLDSALALEPGGQAALGVSLLVMAAGCTVAALSLFLGLVHFLCLLQTLVSSIQGPFSLTVTLSLLETFPVFFIPTAMSA